MIPLLRLTPQSWLKDFRFCLREFEGGKDPTLLTCKLEDRISVYYRGQLLQQQVFKKLRDALNWFWRNQNALEDFGLIVKGPTTRFVQDRLILALYQVFGGLSADNCCVREPLAASVVATIALKP
jgi:hypothetical protein